MNDQPQAAPSPDATSQYETGVVRQRIERALASAGNGGDRLAPADLAALGHFHTMGPLATAALAELARISSADRVLDAGTGIGSTARYLASEVGCRVTGVDLSGEYCEVAAWLTRLVQLEELVTIRQASVLELPFEAGSFDVVISAHVQMNVADKDGLYHEAHRVLAPGGRIAIWDVAAGPVQSPRFPLPWDETGEFSHLIGPTELRMAIERAGFQITCWTDLTELSISVMHRVLASPLEPLGLHAFVPDFRAKAASLVENLEQNRLRMIQAVGVTPTRSAVATGERTS